ncbi:MAG: tRNA (N(6)-L-threonylcarbamoyladenosine(37)-C(2))-methylthiotransferase MtaB [Candidatus Omnitrophica bacterium]|nr:tRNA (N(6)-L-threonylcarbamoyladenosine(37)-C(2))-methylthiotransferase MtaB [Candidatus Omnitrophota bacterium]
MQKNKNQKSPSGKTVCPSKLNERRRVRIITLGCKVNQYETQAITEQLCSAGYEITGQTADIYVINSCTVTASADKKVYSLIKKFRTQNALATIVVCGCLAELNGEILKQKGADIVISQKNKPDILNIIEDRQVLNNSIWSFNINMFPNMRAFVKVQDGCDNFCSFCKIPYLRGKPVSRSKEDVLNEVKRLSAAGHPEIIFTGVNLTMYGREFTDEYDLYNLAYDIAFMPCIGRLRLSSIEPIFVDKKLLSLFKLPKVCPHIHLPFQSCDDDVLKAMNKKERVSLYIDIVNAAREINKDIALSCDIMTGFPYETEQSFENTVSVLKELRPMRMHIFTFSPRENTKFFGKQTLPLATLKKRYAVLNALHKELSLAYYRKFIGKTLNMVTEESIGNDVFGYTENYIRVRARGKRDLGRIIPVKISEVTDENVRAEYAD